MQLDNFQEHRPVMRMEKHIDVLCVDDNEQVAWALRRKLGFTEGFKWKGWLPSADDLINKAKEESPNMVLLDLDMPGKDPLSALSELTDTCPDVRVVVFSGHVSAELINKAIESGAWGYVSKSDGEEALISALRDVAADRFALSAEARAACQIK